MISDRLADRVRRRRARRARRQVRTAGAEADRHLTGRQVDDRRGNEERRDAARTAVEQFRMLTLDGAESADARRDEDADLVGDLRRDRQLRIVDGELARRDREEDEGVDLLDLFLLDELQRVEAFDLARNRFVNARRVEVRDRRDPARPAERIPVRVGPDADR